MEKVFIHSQELKKYSYLPDSMFVTQRTAKHGNFWFP